MGPDPDRQMQDFFGTAQKTKVRKLCRCRGVCRKGYRMSLLSVLALGAAAIYTALGVYSVYRRPNSAVNLVFCLVSAVLAIWSFAYSFVYSASDPNGYWTWFWFKLSAWGWISLPALYLHMAVVITNGNRWPRPAFYLVYLLPLLELYQVNTHILTASGFVPSPLGLVEVIEPSNPWFLIHTAYYLVYLPAALAMIARWGIRSNLIREKRQAWIVVLSCMFVLLAGAATNLILPAAGIIIPGIAPIIGLIWVGAVLFAITKYQFISLTPVLLADEILERVTDLVFIVTPDLHTVRVNKTALQLLGYNSRNLISSSILSIIQERDQLAETISRLQHSPPAQTIDIHMRSDQGMEIPVRAIISSATDSFEDLLGFVIVAQDMRLTQQLEWEISERSKAEEALRYSEEQYRDLFENAHDMILVYDLQGIIISGNYAAELITGYSTQELVGMPFHSLVIPELRPSFLQSLAEGNYHHPARFETSLYSRSGNLINLEVSARPINQNNIITSIQAIARDITARKEAESQLHYLSMHDALTGLYNRAFFTEELLRMNASHNLLGAIMCDLDGLKQINDTLGHNMGDQVLIETAHILESAVGDKGITARLGGDEFAILIPEADQVLLDEISETIRTSFHKLSLFCTPLGISLGSSLKGSEAHSAEDMLRIADQRMYEDKNLHKQHLTQ